MREAEVEVEVEVDMSEASVEASVDVNASLVAQLQTLSLENIDKYDANRFAYIVSMAKKAEQAIDSVRQVVEQKAASALQIYLQDFAHAKQQTSLQVDNAKEQYPDYANKLELLLAGNQFQEISRLQQALDHEEKLSAFAALSLKLRGIDGSGKSASHCSFRDVMLEQENKAVLHYSQVSGYLGDTAHGSQYHRTKQLKAFASFKEFKKKYDTDVLVEKIIDDQPGNLGPLNSHNLLIQSLVAMRGLSPQYLSRFITYVDATLTLERAGEAAVAEVAEAKEQEKKLARKKKAKARKRKKQGS